MKRFAGICCMLASLGFTAPQQQPLRLVLNVPAFSLRVMQDGATIKVYTVAVGSPRYQTRLGDFEIRSITWNPWWLPPESEWARGQKTARPGPLNPMGKVKINYGSLYFLHGTPDSARLAQTVSHGCVRMQNSDAIELALLLQQRLPQSISAAEQQELLKSWARTRVIELPEVVPLEVRYTLVEVADSELIVHRDIYRRGGNRVQMILGALSVALGAAAIDSAAVRGLEGKLNGPARIPLRLLRRD